jgi:hypothetical protein
MDNFHWFLWLLAVIAFAGIIALSILYPNTFLHNFDKDIVIPRINITLLP